MKISRLWLQDYFDDPLPEAPQLAEALTFHAFEIDGLEKHQDDDVLDVKVTPNRGHDCLSHRGIAHELSAILSLPLKKDPLRESIEEVSRGSLTMIIEDTARVVVGAAAHVVGVKVGPSPEWLAKRLQAIGQRSINNVVDATNYVMFDMGMPTHAFDATAFKGEAGAVQYGIRTSQKGEVLALLGGATVELSGSEAVIMDAARVPVDIGGVKGGLSAELKTETTEVVLSASKFAPVETRRAAQRFNQRTEAAKRFENEMADDLALHGLRELAKLVVIVAGGEVRSYGVARSRQVSTREIRVSISKVNAVLGTTLSPEAVADALRRLELSPVLADGDVIVTVPFERLDLEIPEDIIEEVGRIVGYDTVAPQELPPLEQKGTLPAFSLAEQIREYLVNEGFIEVVTSVFAEKGVRAVSNKIGGDKPFLRSSLAGSLQEALARNDHIKEVAGLTEVRLFEIGSVWDATGEHVHVAVGVKGGKRSPKPDVIMNSLFEALGFSAELNLGDGVAECDLGGKTIPPLTEHLPISEARRFEPFSRFPFIVRDVAFWAPASKEAEELRSFIHSHVGHLAIRVDQFDRFEKDGRVSFAFRIIFQAFDQTLTDDDVHPRMESLYEALKSHGYEVR